MTKPTRRYSYWVFILIGAFAGASSALPSLKGSIPDTVYAVLVVVGLICQHIPQGKEQNNVESSEETSGGSR